MNESQRKELIDLMREAEDLGLTFSIGSAYISRAYIDKQTELRSRIDKAIAMLNSEVKQA